jgi:hypothetical protein
MPSKTTKISSATARNTAKPARKAAASASTRTAQALAEGASESAQEAGENKPKVVYLRYPPEQYEQLQKLAGPDRTVNAWAFDALLAIDPQEPLSVRSAAALERLTLLVEASEGRYKQLVNEYSQRESRFVSIFENIFRKVENIERLIMALGNGFTNFIKRFR